MNIPEIIIVITPPQKKNGITEAKNVKKKGRYACFETKIGKSLL